MSKQQSIAQARNNLPSLVREAEAGGTVELTRRGQAVAVLIGRKEYERLANGQRKFGDAYRAFREHVDLEALALDPDRLFSGLRDTSRGRDVKL